MLKNKTFMHIMQKSVHASVSVLISSNGSSHMGISHMVIAKEYTSQAGVMACLTASPFSLACLSIIPSLDMGSFRSSGAVQRMLAGQALMVLRPVWQMK